MTCAPITMAVWNSLRHDARVVRAAATLAETDVPTTVIAASWHTDELGHQAHALGFDVISTPRPQPWALKAGVKGVSLIGLIGRVLRLIPAQWRFGRALWRAHARAYHAHDLQALPTTWLVAKLRCRPIVYDAHEISTDRTALRRLARVVGWVEGLLARRCDAMITTTDMRADHFVATYGVPRPVVLQNRPYFREVPPGDRLRQAVHVPVDVPLILYQGGMQPGRGLLRLLEQMPHVPHAHLVFLGNGVLREALEQRASDLDLNERVHFLDAVPWEQLAEWTASADIGIQLIENTGLNHYTTDSNKIFEYAMAGLPVLASDFPEIRKIVDGHGFGLLVDPADDVAIRAGLNRLAGDAGLRRQLAASAIGARRQLSWETQAPKLVALYRDLPMHPAHQMGEGDTLGR